MQSYEIQVIIQVLEEVEGCPAKTEIPAIFFKKMRKLEKSQNLLKHEN